MSIPELRRHIIWEALILLVNVWNIKTPWFKYLGIIKQLQSEANF